MAQNTGSMSDEGVWAEVASATEGLYDVYLELNELDLQSTTRPTLSGPLDMDRNWDVPTGIQVNGGPGRAQLVGST